MSTPPPRPERRRTRRGSLERPVNGRMYRGTWLLVGLPLLVAAFSVSSPEPLPAPALPPAFDAGSARLLAAELATDYPDRSPGAPGSLGAASWWSRQMRSYGFEVQDQPFHATIPGRGRVRLRNLIATVPGRAPETIVVLAHRDNVGTSEGANDNASGTAVLVELARAYAEVPGTTAARRVKPAHTIAFVSSDGGAWGALGAAHLARQRVYGERVVAVVGIDAAAGRGTPRIVFAGDGPRSGSPVLLRTASRRVLEQAREEPARASALRQLLDLAFPFSLHEQAPFVARGVPAVTLTTSGERPPPAFVDTAAALDRRRLGEVGRAAQALVASVDEGLALRGGEAGFIYLGSRLVLGWAVQLVLIACLLPFLAAAVDLFARCRRRRVSLAPALRSYRSRALFWLFGGAVFGALAVLGAWPDGDPRPLAPDSEAATSWPLLGIAGLGLVSACAWLVVRDRLLPRRPVTSPDELAGYTAALLVLAVLSLVVVATNPYALLLLLPSLHAWLWLPQVRGHAAWARAAVFALGLVGPLLLLASFALRFDLGFDAPWYLAALVGVGYVPATSVLVFLLWAAAAAQLAALTAGRYAPYPDVDERRPRGVLRELAGRTVATARARRRASLGEAEALQS